jgi:hypothetical protein
MCAAAPRRERLAAVAKQLEDLTCIIWHGVKRPHSNLARERHHTPAERLASLALREVTGDDLFGDRRRFSVDQGGDGLSR